MKFLFLQNIISIHQTAFLTELAKKNEVTLVVERAFDAMRDQSGWEVPPMPGVHLYVAPQNECIDLLLKEHTGGICVFCGISAFPMVRRAFLKSLCVKIIRFVYWEPFRSNDWKGILRKCHYSWLHFRFDRYIAAYLPTGELGMKCYQSAGFSSEKLFEWGYFTEPPQFNPVFDSHSFDRPTILFVGSLSPRKNVLVLADVLLKHQTEFSSATFVGEGILHDELVRRVSDSKKIHIIGKVENKKIGQLFQAHDILVLPSHFDGWGAVVNEGLQCGCRIVVSDQCGAASLVENSLRGSVFSGDAVALENALLHEISRGRISSEERIKIRQWAANHISGKIVEKYFMQICNYVQHKGDRPSPPWKQV